MGCWWPLRPMTGLFQIPAEFVSFRESYKSWVSKLRLSLVRCRPWQSVLTPVLLSYNHLFLSVLILKCFIAPTTFYLNWRKGSFFSNFYVLDMYALDILAPFILFRDKTSSHLGITFLKSSRPGPEQTYYFCCVIIILDIFFLLSSFAKARELNRALKNS